MIDKESSLAKEQALRIAVFNAEQMWKDAQIHIREKGVYIHLPFTDRVQGDAIRQYLHRAAKATGRLSTVVYNKSHPQGLRAALDNSDKEPCARAADVHKGKDVPNVLLKPLPPPARPPAVQESTKGKDKDEMYANGLRCFE